MSMTSRTSVGADVKSLRLIDTASGTCCAVHPASVRHGTAIKQTDNRRMIQVLRHRVLGTPRTTG